jgi:hypothetical protein
VRTLPIALQSSFDLGIYRVHTQSSDALKTHRFFVRYAGRLITIYRLAYDEPLSRVVPDETVIRDLILGAINRAPVLEIIDGGRA